MIGRWRGGGDHPAFGQVAAEEDDSPHPRQMILEILRANRLQLLARLRRNAAGDLPQFFAALCRGDDNFAAVRGAIERRLRLREGRRGMETY